MDSIANEEFYQNSIENSPPLKSDEKVKSRYLSPRVASCHDFCKYGIKHDSEAEERRLNFKKLLKKKVPRDEQNQVIVLVPAGRKSKTVTKTTKVETEFSDNTEDSNQQMSPIIREDMRSGEKAVFQAHRESGEAGKKLKTIRAETSSPKLKTIRGTPSPLRSRPSSTLDKTTPLEMKIKKNKPAGDVKKRLQTNDELQANSLKIGDMKTGNMIKEGTSVIVCRNFETSLDELHGDEFEDLAPVSDIGTSKQQDIIEESDTESSVSEKKTDQTSIESEKDGKKLKIARGTPPSPLRFKRLPTSDKNAHATRIAANVKKRLQMNDEAQAKTLSTGGMKTRTTINEGASPTTIVSLHSEASPESAHGDQCGDFAPASKQQDIIVEGDTKSSAPQATEIEEVSPPSERTAHARKPAIALKTKAPLVRSLSKLKPSRSQIVRRNQENKTARYLGALKNFRRELSKPSTAFSSESSRNQIVGDNKIAEKLTPSVPNERKMLKPTEASKPENKGLSSLQPRKFRSNEGNSIQSESSSRLQLRKLRSTKGNSMQSDTSSRLQLRKLRSTRGSSAQSDTASRLQLQKLRSTKGSSMKSDTASSLQLKKLRSTKVTSKPRDSGFSLIPVKLRSIKRASAPQESDSSLKTRKLWNLKLTSKPHESSSSLQLRKLRSVKRSTKHNDNVDHAFTEPRSKNDDRNSTPEVEEPEGNNEVEVSREDKNKKPRRTAAATAQPEDPLPFRLKFKRGKVINLRSDSIGARRLWFGLGLGRLAGDSLNSGAALMKKSFRRKRDASFDRKDPDSEVQSVVLKHQDVSEKKDSKSLFNHVIEETASKLVETRKSKVKALVGAFETVISLQ